ncbi:MAG: hypothetical protein ACK55Q_08560, partial [Dolichospermum sp.]
METRNKQGTRWKKQNKRKQKQQPRQIEVEVDKEDVPKTPVEEEKNFQIQPYVREKSGTRDRIFRFDGKEYTSYSEMVQAKRERNRRVLVESGLLDTTRRLNALVGKTKSPEVHYYAEAASTGSASDTEKEAAIMTSTSMERPRRTNTNYGKGKGSFGREQLDFQSMTTESFTKSK